MSCGGGGGEGGSTPTGPTPPASQLFTLSGIVTEGPATSGGEGYFRNDTGSNQVGGFGRSSQSVLGEQSREREQPDETLIDDNPDIADPLHAAAVGDTLAGVVVRIIDGPHIGKSATTGSDGGYQIVGVSGGMTLTAEKSGYKTQTKSGTVSADTTVNFALAIDIVTYTLSGYVREDGVASSSTAGEPIPGVVVRVMDGPYIDKSSSTGSDGRYEIVGVVGGMTLSATKTGYVTFFKSVTVTSDTTLDFDIGIETRNISGRITDIVTGSAVGNFTVEIEGVGTTTTNGDGQYGFDTDATGILPMTLTGAGYIRRDTYIDAGGPLTVNATVIPDGGDYGTSGFSSAYHDEVFREWNNGITRRWVEQMTIVIHTRKFKCIESNTVTTQSDDTAEACIKGEALEDTSNVFQNNYTDVIASDVSRLTGGKLQGNMTISNDFTLGEEVTFYEYTYNRPGIIDLFLVEYPENDETNANFSWATRIWYYEESSSDYYGRMYSSYVRLNAAHLNATSVYSHELAHTLGWDHPNGYSFSQYPGGSIMSSGTVTSRDELQGRIMYLRPWASRTPDIDPPWFRLNVTNTAGFFLRYAGRSGLRADSVH